MESLYRKLQQNIKSQILAGVYGEGDLLPSENEFQQLHSVTRSTVRHALNELVSEGYILKKQGKGSIVARQQRRTLRCVENDPVMLESTYISNVNLSRFCIKPLVKGSLFETLNVNYAIEITRVDEDLRSVLCDEETARHLRISAGSPLLHIYLKFYTNREHLNVYSSLLCITDKYSIGNRL
jgi:DNA-binding GntR family transcriptional regulator